IKFDNPNRYQISGGGSLTIAVSAGAGSISVVQGSHQINVPVTFSSNTNVSVAAGGALTLGGAATISTNTTVTKTGNLIMQGPLTIQSDGVLQVLSGSTTLRGAPSLASGAKIDATNNAITVDYQGLSNPASAIAQQLATGYNGGAWNGNGIDTSSAIANQTGL